MKTITFLNFANGSTIMRNHAEVVTNATLDVIAKLAKKKCRLASKVVYAEWDACNRMQATKGIIYSGYRAVGQFIVTDNSTP